MDRKNVKERHFYYELPDELFDPIEKVEAQELNEIIRELISREMESLRQKVGKGYIIEPLHYF